jgi:hypothetical protein
MHRGLVVKSTMFRDNSWIPSSSPFFLDCLTLENGTDKFSRNDCNYQFALCNVPEERISCLVRVRTVIILMWRDEFVHQLDNAEFRIHNFYLKWHTEMIQRVIIRVSCCKTRQVHDSPGTIYYIIWCNYHTQAKRLPPTEGSVFHYTWDIPWIMS